MIKFEKEVGVRSLLFVLDQIRSTMSSPATPLQNFTQDLLLQTLSRQSSPVVQEIITVLQSIGCSDKSMKEVVSRLLKRVPYVVLLIVVTHYASNTEQLMSALKRLGWHSVKSLVYTRTSYDRGSTEGPEKFIFAEFNKEPEVIYSFGIPMYRELYGDIMTVYHISSIHSGVFNEIVERGRQEYSRMEDSSTLFFHIRDNYRNQNPKELYPSRNYSAIMESFRVRIILEGAGKMYNVSGVLIDGVPGLGKSNLADFAARSGLFHRVYRADLNSPEHLNKTPATLFRAIYSNISVTKGPTMFMIDEMDKWLAFYIDKSYNDLKYGSGDSKNKSEEKEAPSPTTGAIPSYDEHRKTVKNSFLQSLQDVLSRPNIDNTCIIVFCCNNFNTIFDNIEMTHYESLQDRFSIVDFEMCDREEIIHYYMYYNNIYGNNEKAREFHVRPDILEKILADINPAVRITHRALNDLSFKNCFKYAEIVKVLNDKHVDRSLIPSGVPVGISESSLAASSGSSSEGGRSSGSSGGSSIIPDPEGSGLYIVDSNVSESASNVPFITGCKVCKTGVIREDLLADGIVVCKNCRSDDVCSSCLKETISPTGHPFYILDSVDNLCTECGLRFIEQGKYTIGMERSCTIKACRRTVTMDKCSLPLRKLCNYHVKTESVCEKCFDNIDICDMYKSDKYYNCICAKCAAETEGSVKVERKTIWEECPSIPMGKCAYCLSVDAPKDDIYCEKCSGTRTFGKNEYYDEFCCYCKKKGFCTMYKNTRACKDCLPKSSIPKGKGRTKLNCKVCKARYSRVEEYGEGINLCGICRLNRCTVCCETFTDADYQNGSNILKYNYVRFHRKCLNKFPAKIQSKFLSTPKSDKIKNCVHCAKGMLKSSHFDACPACRSCMRSTGTLGMCMLCYKNDGDDAGKYNNFNYLHSIEPKDIDKFGYTCADCSTKLDIKYPGQYKFEAYCMQCTNDFDQPKIDGEIKRVNVCSGCNNCCVCTKSLSEEKDVFGLIEIDRKICGDCHDKNRGKFGEAVKLVIN